MSYSVVVAISALEDRSPDSDSSVAATISVTSGSSSNGSGSSSSSLCIAASQTEEQPGHEDEPDEHGVATGASPTASLPTAATATATAATAPAPLEENDAADDEEERVLLLRRAKVHLQISMLAKLKALLLFHKQQKQQQQKQQQQQQRLLHPNPSNGALPLLPPIHALQANGLNSLILTLDENDDDDKVSQKSILLEHTTTSHITTNTNMKHDKNKCHVLGHDSLLEVSSGGAPRMMMMVVDEVVNEDVVRDDDDDALVKQKLDVLHKKNSRIELLHRKQQLLLAAAAVAAKHNQHHRPAPSYPKIVPHSTTITTTTTVALPVTRTDLLRRRNELKLSCSSTTTADPSLSSSSVPKNNIAHTTTTTAGANDSRHKTNGTVSRADLLRRRNELKLQSSATSALSSSSLDHPKNNTFAPTTTADDDDLRCITDGSDSLALPAATRADLLRRRSELKLACSTGAATRATAILPRNNDHDRMVLLDSRTLCSNRTASAATTLRLQKSKSLENVGSQTGRSTVQKTRTELKKRKKELKVQTRNLELLSKRVQANSGDVESTATVPLKSSGSYDNIVSETGKSSNQMTRDELQRRKKELKVKTRSLVVSSRREKANDLASQQCNTGSGGAETMRPMVTRGNINNDHDVKGQSLSTHKMTRADLLKRKQELEAAGVARPTAKRTRIDDSRRSNDGCSIVGSKPKRTRAELLMRNKELIDSHPTVFAQNAKSIPESINERTKVSLSGQSMLEEQKQNGRLG